MHSSPLCANTWVSWHSLTSLSSLHTIGERKVCVAGTVRRQDIRQPMEGGDEGLTPCDAPVRTGARLVTKDLNELRRMKTSMNKTLRRDKAAGSAWRRHWHDHSASSTRRGRSSQPLCSEVKSITVITSSPFFRSYFEIILKYFES